MKKVIDLIQRKEIGNLVSGSYLHEFAWAVASSHFLDSFRILTAYMFFINGVFLLGKRLRRLLPRQLNGSRKLLLPSFTEWCIVTLGDLHTECPSSRDT